MSQINCVDTSSFQGKKNWEKVRSDGVEYAILRTIRKGLRVDSSFDTDYGAARAAGLKVGGYLYTYATTAAYAAEEANALLELLDGRTLKLPVWLDMETSALRRASAATVQRVADAFRKPVEQAGYSFGIYCDKDFYAANGHFSGYDADCPFWIASYGANDGRQHAVPNIAHKLFGHQFSSRGRVSGINGNVDVSKVYETGETAAKTASGRSYDMDTLRKGDKGQQVRALQIILNSRTGAGLSVDGIFGGKTLTAVKEYQHGCGLLVDGIVGQRTWEMVLK